MLEIICPECRDGKHNNCIGQALDPMTDDIVSCTCTYCELGEVAMSEIDIQDIQKDDSDRFLKLAKAAVQIAYKTEFDISIPVEELYIVWSAKTLQNYKALLSTDSLALRDGLYFEVTLNGDKGETYVDIYHRVSNQAISNSIFGL
jgi:hypothetical protein